MSMRKTSQVQNFCSGISDTGIVKTLREFQHLGQKKLSYNIKGVYTPQTVLPTVRSPYHNKERLGSNTAQQDLEIISSVLRVGNMIPSSSHASGHSPKGI